MNKDLKNNNNNDFYLPFIKSLYKGVEMESFPLASNNNILFRGTLIENKEIDEIEKHKQKKNNNFSTTIVFSKVFLSFSKKKNKEGQLFEFIPHHYASLSPHYSSSSHSYIMLVPHYLI